MLPRRGEDDRPEQSLALLASLHPPAGDPEGQLLRADTRPEDGLEDLVDRPEGLDEQGPTAASVVEPRVVRFVALRPPVARTRVLIHPSNGIEPATSVGTACGQPRSEWRSARNKPERWHLLRSVPWTGHDGGKVGSGCTIATSLPNSARLGRAVRSRAVADSLLELTGEIAALLGQAHTRSGNDWIAIAADKVAALATTAKRTAVVYQGQPVIDRWLPIADELAEPATRPLLDLVQRHVGELSWCVPYGHVVGNPIIDEFRDNYSFAWLAGRSTDGPGAAPLISDDVMVAVTLQAPRTFYPEHHHSAVEVYSPIAGTAQWFSDTLGWRVERPGDVIAHGEDEVHAMTTGDETLLTYVVWISDLASQPHLTRRED